MAETGLTAAEVRQRARVNSARVAVTTDDEIRRQMIEDGEDPDHPEQGWFPAPASVRERLGLTQTEIADLLGLPIATWQAWEELRTGVEPAGQALLRILWKEPEAARRALGRQAA
jgi:putative transcriptional regulator